METHNINEIHKLISESLANGRHYEAATLADNANMKEWALEIFESINEFKKVANIAEKLYYTHRGQYHSERTKFYEIAIRNYIKAGRICEAADVAVSFGKPRHSLTWKGYIKPAKVELSKEREDFFKKEIELKFESLKRGRDLYLDDYTREHSHFKLHNVIELMAELSYDARKKDMNLAVDIAVEMYNTLYMIIEKDPYYSYDSRVGLGGESWLYLYNEFKDKYPASFQNLNIFRFHNNRYREKEIKAAERLKKQRIKSRSKAIKTFFFIGFLILALIIEIVIDFKSLNTFLYRFFVAVFIIISGWAIGRRVSKSYLKKNPID